MRVKKAEYLNRYKLRLLFNDNKTKIVDLEKELWGTMYEPLKDLEYFKKVFVDDDLITIQWPNGADFSPDFLYEIGKEEKTAIKKTHRNRYNNESFRQPAHAFSRKRSKKNELHK